MRVGPSIAGDEPAVVRTAAHEGADVEAHRIVDVIAKGSAKATTSIRTNFPSSRWNEWTVAVVEDRIQHRMIITLHEDAFAQTGPLDPGGPEVWTLIAIARRVLAGRIDGTSRAETANSLDTVFEATMMRRLVDPDLEEAFDVIWSGVTQFGPARISAQTTFLDAASCDPSDGMPIGRIVAQVEEEDEFERPMPTLRISVESNIVRVDRIDAMERLRIEREAAIRAGEAA